MGLRPGSIGRQRAIGDDHQLWWTEGAPETTNWVAGLGTLSPEPSCLTKTNLPSESEVRPEEPSDAP